MEIIDKLKGELLLKEFKEEMSKHLTLIGDYVGSNTLIKYSKSSIIFNSIVENNSNIICLPITQSYDLFLKFKLNFSPVEKISKPIRNFSQLTTVLKEIYLSVSASFICNDEEGSVINIYYNYFFFSELIIKGSTH